MIVNAPMPRAIIVINKIYTAKFLGLNQAEGCLTGAGACTGGIAGKDTDGVTAATLSMGAGAGGTTEALADGEIGAAGWGVATDGVYMSKGLVGGGTATDPPTKPLNVFSCATFLFSFVKVFVRTYTYHYVFSVSLSQGEKWDF